MWVTRSVFTPGYSSGTGNGCSPDVTCCVQCYADLCVHYLAPCRSSMSRRISHKQALSCIPLQRLPQAHQALLPPTSTGHVHLHVHVSCTPHKHMNALQCMHSIPNRWRQTFKPETTSTSPRQLPRIPLRSTCMQPAVIWIPQTCKRCVTGAKRARGKGFWHPGRGKGS